MVSILRLLAGVKVTLLVEASNATVPIALGDNVKLLATIEGLKRALLKVPLMTESLATPTAPLKGLTAVTVGALVSLLPHAIKPKLKRAITNNLMGFIY